MRLHVLFHKLTVVFFLCGIQFLSAQSLQHPVIWVTQEEKGRILNLVEQYDWAKIIVDDLHNIVDEKVNIHQSDPGSILLTIPAIPDDDDMTEFEAKTVEKHVEVLTDASHAAMLYYLTEEDKYAQFSADILSYYADVLAPREPQNTTICGNNFYDPRTSYAKFAITYDFIYNFLMKPGTKVYKNSIKSYRAYDNDVFQKTIVNMVGNTLQEYGEPDQHGKFISNHPILTAPGALFGILCVDDDKERERLFNVFWEKGTAHQNSFKNTILPMFGKQGIWPESTSYSFMPLVTLVLNIVDRVYPEMDVTQDYKNIFKGSFLFDNLRMPDGRFVRYGDSKRNNDGTQALYRYTLNLAERRGYTQLDHQAKVALRQAYNAVGGYHPEIKQAVFDDYQALKLFWGIPIPEDIQGSIDFKKPTVLVEHAGIALQRNYVEKNNELYGLCGIIGGAHYVHSHVTGISMELYGAGYVMAPNAGLPPSVPERRIPLHENYFRLYAGNNSVIVNGTSHGLQEGSWKPGAYVWQNTVTNLASEPKHLEDPVDKNFSFATQYLKDTVNFCEQERTLSTIRTSEKTGYYFDLFRSKSMHENKFHDYIYHNIGDVVSLKDGKGNSLKTKPTDRYQNDIGDPVQSPGWRYFENTEVTKSTKDEIKVRFHLDYDDSSMHMFLPGGISREYTTALAPPTREAKNGYVNKKTQVLAIRQQGEAWNRPFIAVFEPAKQTEPGVQSLEPLLDGDKVVGAKVVSQVGTTLITDYIISQESPNSIYFNKALKLRFTGRFGIVRIEETAMDKKLSLYIGEGSELSFNIYYLEGQNQDKAFKSFSLK